MAVRGALLLLLVCCGLQLIRAAVYIEILDERPDFPGKCYIPQDGTFHDIGSRWYKKGICEELACSSDTESGKMIVEHRGCGLVMGEGLCTVIPEDNSKPYPSCCSSVSCRGDSEEELQAVSK